MSLVFVLSIVPEEAPLNIVLLLLGITLLVVVVVDALWTTLWVDGSGGPITSWATTWMWRGALAAIGRQHHHRLSLFGPIILMSTVVMWIALLWAGWVVLFGSEGSSLLHAHNQTPADWSARFYFVGYMMFTAGNGDFSPNGDSWQVAGALTNASGMLVATLAITYLLSVVSAVVRKRAFASAVTGLGMEPEDVIRNAWDGRDLHTLDSTLNSLASQLSTLSEQYLSYPVLQYYHAARPDKSPILAIAVLDDALTLLRFGVHEEQRPNPVILRASRAAVASFLDTLPSAFIHAAPQAPPPPDLDRLRQLGIPTVNDADFAAALEQLTDRRRKLLGLVRNDGWNWREQ